MDSQRREISPSIEGSSFAKLPREIRDEIYEYALRCDNGIRISVGDQRPHLLSPPSSSHPLALTQVCKQIRDECHTVFYSANLFRLVVRSGDSHSCEIFETWLKGIDSESAAAINRVDIELGFWSPGYTRPSSVTRFATPLPIQAASFIICLRELGVSGTFSIKVGYSDIPGLGSFTLTEIDLIHEAEVFATSESAFEQACLLQAKKIDWASSESRIEGYAVIRLMMGLDRCRNSFAEFLSTMTRELEIQRAIRQAKGMAV